MWVQEVKMKGNRDCCWSLVQSGSSAKIPNTELNTSSCSVLWEDLRLNRPARMHLAGPFSIPTQFELRTCPKRCWKASDYYFNAHTPLSRGQPSNSNAEILSIREYIHSHWAVGVDAPQAAMMNMCWHPTDLEQIAMAHHRFHCLQKRSWYQQAWE